MYFKKYENISDLKAAIISAFQEVSDGMVTSIISTYSVRRLEMVLRNKGEHLEKLGSNVLVCIIYQNPNVV